MSDPEETVKCLTMAEGLPMESSFNFRFSDFMAFFVGISTVKLIYRLYYLNY